MKRLVGVIVITSAAILIATQLRASINSQPVVAGYDWVKAVDTGKPGWPRWIKPMVGSGGKLWMIAADGAWSSSNAAKWVRNEHNISSATLPGVSPASFDNKLWLMGGMKNWADFTNGVSFSNDGIHWTVATPNAPWGRRRNAMTAVFAGKLWLLGGQISSGRVDQTPTSEYHDVWNTTDGINWTRVTENAPWSLGTAVVFRNRIWIFGNGEAWNSFDGRVWVRAAKDVAALRRGSNGCTVFDGKVWIYGGVPQTRAVNDVWNSADGIQWNLVSDHAPWFPRGAEYSVAFNDKLWIFGGKTGTHYEQADDIWYMSKATSSR